MELDPSTQRTAHLGFGSVGLVDNALRQRASCKNLFLAASIRSGAISAPVRIRNLSQSGAMIEAAALPDIGAALALARQEIEIGAVVVWRLGGRLSFDTAVVEASGLAGTHGSPSPIRVDSLPESHYSCLQAPTETMRDGDVS